MDRRTAPILRARQRGSGSGKPIEVFHADDAAYGAGLVAGGLPEELAPMLVSFGASIRLGTLERVTDVVETIGGRPPTSLRTLLTAT